MLAPGARTNVAPNTHRSPFRDLALKGSREAICSRPRRPQTSCASHARRSCAGQRATTCPATSSDAVGASSPPRSSSDWATTPPAPRTCTTDLLLRSATPPVSEAVARPSARPRRQRTRKRRRGSNPRTRRECPGVAIGSTRRAPAAGGDESLGPLSKRVEDGARTERPRSCTARLVTTWAPSPSRSRWIWLITSARPTLAPPFPHDQASSRTPAVGSLGVAIASGLGSDTPTRRASKHPIVATSR